MINLESFCAKDNDRHIGIPFSRGVYTFATNGHILVRVPRITDIPDRDGAPDPLRLFEKASTIGDPVPIPDLPPEVWHVCWLCAEEGVISADCEECNGDGKYRDTQYIQVGEMSFDHKYLEMIKALPGYKFYPVKHDLSISSVPPSYFTFDGGDGLLMPVKT